MAEVTSSSLVGSTLFFCRFAGKTRRCSEGPGGVPALLDDSLTTVRATLGGEYVFHRTRGVVAHTGDHVGIGIERDRNGSVTQEFLDVLRVYVAAQ